MRRVPGLIAKTLGLTNIGLMFYHICWDLQKDANETYLNRYMITITEKAKDYMKSVLLNGDHVTLAVKGGGCSGFQYVWGLKNDHPDVEWSSPIEGVLVLDPLAEMYVLGSEIDYISELGGSYLAVKNPTSTSSCGCGESFGV